MALEFVINMLERFIPFKLRRLILERKKLRELNRGKEKVTAEYRRIYREEGQPAAEDWIVDQQFDVRRMDFEISKLLDAKLLRKAENLGVSISSLKWATTIWGMQLADEGEEQLKAAIKVAERDRREKIGWWLKTITKVVAILTGLVVLIGYITTLRLQ